jgi:GTPase SAR1 family protein
MFEKLKTTSDKVSAQASISKPLQSANSATTLSDATQGRLKINKPKKSQKIVLIGDGAIGKTCLIGYYSTRKFLNDYIPTVFENVRVNMTLEDENYELSN